MSAPQNIQPHPDARDAGVAAFDAAGNETLSGNLVMTGGAIVLGALKSAPGPVPGEVQIYTTDGVNLKTVGAGGVAGGQTVAGNLIVTGTAKIGGATEIDNNLAVFANNGSGSVMVQNGTAVSGAANADVSIAEATAASVALGLLVSGDANNRFQTTTAGTLSWGNGTAGPDTNLSRASAGVLAQPASNTAAAAAVLTPTFANGTAAQLTDTTRDYMVYLQVGTAGTATTLAIGPTSGVANTLKTSSAANAGDLWSFRLPAGWFVKWAGTTTTVATQTAIGC